MRFSKITMATKFYKSAKQQLNICGAAKIEESVIFMTGKKALVLGGTGALGVYMVEELLKTGNRVDAVTIDNVVSDNPNLRYLKVDAKDDNVLDELLKNNYDVVIDYMLYFGTEEFSKRYLKILDNTKHYIYLSSYRIYADSDKPITEESDRLLDVATDETYLNSNDYSLYKARQEDMLHASGRKNYTILRPAITYSKNRFQLTILEAPTVVYRMRKGKTLVLPEEAMDKQATMSWSYDAARMVSALLLNEKAFGEVYTISTSEHHTWREIAEIYKELGGLKYVTTDYETFLNIIAPGNIHTRQQLTYDRLFNRMVDNTKILEISGLKQSDLMPLKDGLKHELDRLPMDTVWEDDGMNERMDLWLKEQGIE